MLGKQVSITSGCKNQWGLKLWKIETAGIPGSSSWRSCAQTYSDSLPLSFSVGGSILKGAKDTQGRTELSITRVRAGGSFLPDVLAEIIVPFLSPSPQSQQAGAISETPSTWLPLFATPWWFPEALPHPTFRHNRTVSSGCSIPLLVLAYASDFPKFSQVSSIWLQQAPYLSLRGPRLALAAAGFGSQLGLSWALPSPAQVAAICRLLSGLCCVTLDRTQAVEIKAQLQQGVCTDHTVGTPWEPTWATGKLCHWTLQDTYYIRPPYQAWEM